MAPDVVDDGIPARAYNREDALTLLQQWNDEGFILFEGPATSGSVSLDGWDPDAGAKLDGCVAGVVVRYHNTARKSDAPGGGSAPDRLDARNALALVRLCYWLKENKGATDLYHLGISGGAGRTDCHGQGRAVDFVGGRGTDPTTGEAWEITVADDWGLVDTPLTPGGHWPHGTGPNTSYRLDSVEAPTTEQEYAREFFRELFTYMTTQYQDAGTDPDPTNRDVEIHGGYIMHPDHPDSNPAPGAKNGREAHWQHLHAQIGVTGTA